MGGERVELQELQKVLSELRKKLLFVKLTPGWKAVVKIARVLL